ncbi:MAG: mannosyltransferase, partial [Acidimicrobiaceae bacterium]
MPSGPGSRLDTRDPSLGPIEFAVVAVAVAVGVVLRFWTRSHLWLDEALSVDIARLPVGDIASALRHDGHPPLYYFLLHGWMSVFGEGDTAVRSMSGVFAVAALPVAWMAGRRVGGRVTAWAFVALLSLSPFAIRYGTETRMYSLVMLLVFAGYLLVANALER